MSYATEGLRHYKELARQVTLSLKSLHELAILLQNRCDTEKEYALKLEFNATLKFTENALAISSNNAITRFQNLISVTSDYASIFTCTINDDVVNSTWAAYTNLKKKFEKLQSEYNSMIEMCQTLREEYKQAHASYVSIAIKASKISCDSNSPRKIEQSRKGLLLYLSI